MQERFEALVEMRKQEDPKFVLGALNVFMGKQVVDIISASDVFTSKGSGTQRVAAVRERLKAQGMILPIVRWRDLDVNPREFIISFEDKVIFDAEFPEKETITAEYMIDKLEEIVKNRYSELNNK